MSNTGAQIIELAKYAKTRVASGASPEVAQDLQQLSVASGTVSTESKWREERRAISEFYPGLSDSSLLQRAMQLMADALGICQRVLEHLEGEDVIEADLECMRLKSVLVELFCCREIGEGYANTIDALLTGVRRFKDGPMERAQVLAIRECLHKIYDAPALSFDESFALIDLLEEAGFLTEPDLSGLADDPDE